MGGKQPSTSSDRSGVSSNAPSEVTQEEMINITSCDFADFAAYMSRQYGQAQFAEGFNIVKGKQDLIYQDDGEEQMVRLLGHLFGDQDTCRGFINFCTTYLIVQNMQFGN